MVSGSKQIDDARIDNEGSFSSYTIGFVLSIALTLLAYFLVVNHVLVGEWLVISVMGLAILQALVQLLFFLHLGAESQPRWGFYTFIFMVVILVIIVVGSLWVMSNLDYRMMPAM